MHLNSRLHKYRWLPDLQTGS